MSLGEVGGSRYRNHRYKETLRIYPVMAGIKGNVSFSVYTTFLTSPNFPQWTHIIIIMKTAIKVSFFHNSPWPEALILFPSFLRECLFGAGLEPPLPERCARSWDTEWLEGAGLVRAWGSSCACSPKARPRSPAQGPIGPHHYCNPPSIRMWELDHKEGLSAKELMLSNCGAGGDSWKSLGLQAVQTSQFQRKSTLNIHWKDWCCSWIL